MSARGWGLPRPPKCPDSRQVRNVHCNVGTRIVRTYVLSGVPCLEGGLVALRIILSHASHGPLISKMGRIYHPYLVGLLSGGRDELSTVPGMWQEGCTLHVFNLCSVSPTEGRYQPVSALTVQIQGYCKWQHFHRLGRWLFTGTSECFKIFILKASTEAESTQSSWD